VMAKYVIMKRDEDGPDLADLRALLESLSSIYGDEDLSQAERAAMIRASLAEYKEETGRDGLRDVASMRGEKDKDEPEMEKHVDVGELAMFALECAANNLRKADPSLSEAQAFAKAYVAPENRVAMKAERQASRARLAGVAQTERQASRSGTPRERIDPEILPSLDDDDIRRLNAEQRREHPFETPEQLYSRVYNSPAMREHRAQLRARMQTARRDGSTWLSASVAKRDDAMGSLRAKADQLRASDPRLSAEGAFSKAYRMFPELAKAERSASRAALYG
jgi:hypothetical protein